MDIREYVYVLAIVDSGNVTSAAKKLHISQPSLSIYIKKLESRLRFPIFDHSSKKLFLTPEGRIYVEYARQITGLNDEMYQKLSRMEHLESGSVRIGITDTKGSLFLPQLIPLLNETFPHLEIYFYENSSNCLQDKVMDREFDFILVNYPYDSYEYGLDFIELFKEEFLVALPANSPLCSKAVLKEDLAVPWLDIELLKNEKFILAKPGLKLRQIADYLFLSKRFQPQVIMETGNMATSCSLTQAGVGVSFIMDTFVNFLPAGTRSLFLASIGDPQLITDYVIAFPKDCHLSKAALMVIDLLKEKLPLIKSTAK